MELHYCSPINIFSGIKLSRFLFVIGADIDFVQDFLCATVRSLKTAVEIQRGVCGEANGDFRRRLEVRKYDIRRPDDVGFARHFCYRMAFYPYFCTITIQSSISFYHGVLRPIPSDSDDSWEDYILKYLNISFTSYALRVSHILQYDFRSDCRCKRFSRFFHH